MTEGLKKMSGEFVPVWNGNPEKFEEYRVRGQIYVNSVESWKQPQRISNLVQSLESVSYTHLTLPTKRIV